ncbi:MAG: endonuclease MutS2 [Dehalococcoidales bacterium]|nr:MAG: endonuclease MutS2 [Dehalococcoidales bacterium]
MDDKSLKILEFPEIIKILAGYTSFPVGCEMVLDLKPVSDYDRVSLWLGQSREARHLLSRDPDFTVSGAFDIRETTKVAALGKMLEPVNLVEIQHTLAVMRKVRSSLHSMSEEVPLFWHIAQGLVELPGVEKEITRCLSPDGEVLNQASSKLAAVRKQLREVRQVLRDRLEEIIRTPKGQRIIQEPIITEREGRSVIPVKTEFRKEIEGITHDVSNTGATVFIEPWATVELGNTIRELVSEGKREEERILRNLSTLVGTHEADILISVSRLAELDMTLAKARYARAVKAAEPDLISFVDTSVKDRTPAFLGLVDARHPLLGQEAVPLSVELGQDFSILVITGPNTGGKTVALKTIGLLILMTQAGIPIPASPETRLPVFDSIFAHIGDEQSIEQTLSSFSWHIGNIVRIIQNATERSLVLIDELGTSTDPAEGSALARSVLLHFLSSGILTMATTHYGDLKAFAHVTPGLQNASFDFDPVTLTPTYHMTLGIPGGSNALATAARLGVPPAIIDEARTMLSKGSLDLDATLADVMAEKERIEAVREVLEKEKAETKARNAELESRLTQLRAEEQRVIQEARDRVVYEMAELHRQIRQVSSELRKKRTSEKVDTARKALSDAQARLDSEEWALKAPEAGIEPGISVGDTVYLTDMNLHGTVLSIFEKTQEVEVQAGHIKLRVAMNSIERRPNATVVPPATPDKTIRLAPGVISAELDLRGKRADEIEVALDSYLNDATLVNLNEVLVIHGTATGTVRQIVRDLLGTHPLVKSFRAGGQGEGGDGVTVVSL